MTEPPSRPGERRLIAAAEGDGEAAARLQDNLQCDGREVRIFPTGQALLDAGVHRIADLFILADRLPDLPGPAVLSRLRAAGAQAPALFLTDWLSEDLCSRACEYGAPILARPVTRGALDLAIRLVLQGAAPGPGGPPLRQGDEAAASLKAPAAA